MLHIKLKGTEHRAPWKQTCCHYTHQRPLGWGQEVILFLFSKSGHVLHIKLKWKKCRPTCKVTLWIYTHLWPLGLSLKVRYWNCADVSIFYAPAKIMVGALSVTPVRPYVRMSVPTTSALNQILLIRILWNLVTLLSTIMSSSSSIIVHISSGFQ